MRAVLFQMDQEFDESDTPVADLVATLQVLLAHPSIDLSVLVDKVCVNFCSFTISSFVTVLFCYYCRATILRT